LRFLRLLQIPFLLHVCQSYLVPIISLHSDPDTAVPQANTGIPMSSSSSSVPPSVESDLDLLKDSFSSLISDATGAASAFGSWFVKTANEKAPEIVEKSKVAFVRTKTATLEAYDKASEAAKKASGALEEFIEKQMGDEVPGEDIPVVDEHAPTTDLEQTPPPPTSTTQ
jgi:hypothetical protein